MSSSDEPATSREEKAAKIRKLLSTEGAAVGENTRGFNRNRQEATAKLDDYDELKARARAIKEDAIERLPELIETVRESTESRGGNVYLADDAADASAYVREVADGAGVDAAVKSKSMTSEEIDVNEALRGDGVEVWETDLGEFVIQLAEESPSHLVGPAVHHDTDSIAALFDAHFDPDEPLETADDLTRFAREFLGERIAAADLGMTGANFVAAEEGTLAIVASEGNARKTVATTDVHVAVAGVEKLIPSLSDLPPFLELLARSATGQSLTSYLSVLTPPGSAPTVDFGADEMGEGEREFHLVLIDNGRMAMREDDELRETLYCIRCGACANACANFQHVGGHAFGGETYTGGIAGGWEAGVHGLDSAAEFNDLCTGCTRCVPACPVGIDVPWINTVVRDRVNRGADPSRFDFLVEGLAPDAEAGGLDVQKRLFGNVETLARVASATAPVSNWLAHSTPGKLALSRLGVDPRRDLPTFRRRTLRDWFEARDGSAAGPGAETDSADREVVLYPDVYTNYAAVERGKAAVRILEALGADVRIPAIPESGRAPLSQGMIDTAERAAEGVVDALAPHLDAGRDVVVIEPSDLAMFRRDYDRLVPGRADDLAENSYEVLEYVHGLLANGADADALPELDGSRFAYHPHCQGRTLGLAGHTEWVLDARGADVARTEAECCGMAGSFGYKREYYELSEAVGESLVAELDDDREILASGTSCLEQLGSLGESPRHPVEVLAPD